MAAVEIIFGVGILLTLVVSLVQCLRCKESDRKHGESLNNNEPQGQNCHNGGGHCNSNDEDQARHNRLRELPAIPPYTNPNDDVEAGNGAAESAGFYATVENDGHHNVPDRSKRINGDLPAHSYDKIKMKDTVTVPYDVPKVEENSQMDSDSLYEPIPPPVPDKRYDSSEPSTSGQGNSQPNTSAASAVAGRASAVDIPLITPVNPSDQDLYNSSQLSEKYTRISVREPLTEMRPWIRYPVVEPHYSDVPDDSDKMYAEIYSAQNSRHSSDTYSTISREPPVYNGDIPPDPPPLESLRNAAQAHSRQASLSSFVSEVGQSSQANNDMENMYSKIDKSKKNRTSVHVMESGASTSIHDEYAQVQKPHRRLTTKADSHGSGSVSRYSFATHGSSSGDTVRKPLSEAASSSVVRRSSSKDDPGYEKIRENPWNRSSVTSEHRPPKIDNDYEVVRPPKGSFRDYETIGGNRSYPIGLYDDEEVEPGYEEVHQNHIVDEDECPCDAGYEMVGESSFQRSDPNYESLRYGTVQQQQSSSSTTEPPYWQIQSGPTEVGGDPLYEKISGMEDDSTGVKHGYEKIKHKNQNSEMESGKSEEPDPGYETISNDRTNMNKVALHISWNNGGESSTASAGSPPYLDMKGEHDSCNQSNEEDHRLTNESSAGAFDDSDSLL